MVDNFVCIDLETTGLNPKRDKIIEIGAVKVERGQIVDLFETFVNPHRKLEERIVQLTGITDEDLSGAPDMAQVLPQVLAFIGEDILLGHSILFDYSFLKKAAVDQKMKFERLGVDTLKIARKFLPELESRSLDFLCQHYQIPHRAHRALEDAKATAALYQILKNQFATEETKKDFLAGNLLFNVKRDTPATKAQVERLYKLIELHKLSPEIAPEQMTRSEASRYTDQVLAKYGRL
ncbi:MAG: 3'-5' exonuclease [Lachnospiraceae bacterium]|nr:3'-5' exonuclease [Lachnospiraceae bacterium]